ncbi:MAG TPA: PQQ-binding-like beta-propeller repeat protein [Armatimonadota bacterium]|nr:PQQ-binding-like beta-propeller repeat protein [Armatimonadota bacterium]
MLLDDLSTIVAIRVDTGTQAWRRNAASEHLHASDDERFYLGSSGLGAGGKLEPRFRVLDAITGNELWSSLSSSSNYVAAGGGRVAWIAHDQTVHCADARTGRILWRLPGAAPGTMTREIALLTVDPEDARRPLGMRAAFVNPATGERLKTFTIDDTLATGYDAKFLLTRKPELLLVSEIRAGVGFESYNINAFRSDGTLAWHAPELSGTTIASGTVVGMWWRNGIHYKHLGVRAVSMRNGKPLWTRRHGRDRSSYPVGAWGPAVLILDAKPYGKTRMQDRILALDARSGRQRWRISGPADAAAVSGPWLIVLYDDVKRKRVTLRGYRFRSRGRG